uniref:Uncharacterized protein n=1 Tax=Glossina palpalis gambiensis TaxID=67801 RepID=A0A1B0B5R0_9MUSC
MCTRSTIQDDFEKTVHRQTDGGPVDGQLWLNQILVLSSLTYSSWPRKRNTKASLPSFSNHVHARTRTCAQLYIHTARVTSSGGGFTSFLESYFASSAAPKDFKRTTTIINACFINYTTMYLISYISNFYGLR